MQYNATIIGTYISGLTRKSDRTTVVKTILNNKLSSPKVASFLCERGCTVSDRTVREFRQNFGSTLTV